MNLFKNTFLILYKKILFLLILVENKDLFQLDSIKYLLYNLLL